MSRKSWAEKVMETIAADIASGRLAAGDQLPTQRAMARQLGITTGTVNRGYALAERAGLVSAEVGRGTFVTAGAGAMVRSTGIGREPAGAIDLAINYPAGDEAEQALRAALSRETPRGILGVAPYEGRPAHRDAGAHWMRHLGLASVDGSQVLVCTSVQHGLAASLAACTSPGDCVMTEDLTSPAITSIAAMSHLRLVPVACDREGIVAEALAEACRSSGSRVLYTMPTLHTPTTTTMTEARRRDIARVIERESITTFEDDAWGFLAAGQLEPLASRIPDWCVYLTSFSKSLAPGIRVGYVVAPPRLRRDIASCIGTMTWAAPLMVELVSQWIEDGTAVRIAEQRRRTARVRQRLAAKILGRTSVLPAYHLWLPLPEPWRAEDLVNRAAAIGVSIAPTEIFVPARAARPHAVRLCLGTEPQAGRVEDALRRVKRLLASGPRLAAIASVR